MEGANREIALQSDQIAGQYLVRLDKADTVINDNKGGKPIGIWDTRTRITEIGFLLDFADTSSSRRLPGGTLSSSNHVAESNWSSLRVATRQMDCGQAFRATFDALPLKISSAARSWNETIKK